MGKYINIGYAGFQRARNSEYVDKSGLIAVVNNTLFTERCFSCVTRCRRFGKSMAAKMLYAYYDHSCDSRSKVNPTKFQNDMSIIRSKDDALTVLIHLGYLSYNWKKSECYIPNKEVAGEMVNAIEENKWMEVVKAVEASEQLLQATLDGDEEAVARGVDAAHDEHTSILSYNNENSLACVLSIAYYYAKNDYIMNRELPTGKGFADIVLIPRKNVESPAIVLELKYNQDADTAIDQILRQQYPTIVAQYAGDMLLVGINYDRKLKTHHCRIVRMEK